MVESKSINARRCIVGILLFVIFPVVWSLYYDERFKLDAILAFFRQHPAWAPLVFVGIYAGLVILLLPTLPLNLAAGFFWGAQWGGIYAAAGATLGAMVAFSVSRYVAHDYINRRFQGRAWLALRGEVERQGWKVVAFVRLNPIFPFGPTNYFLGLTPIRVTEYLWATVLFVLPLSLLIASLGSSIKSITLKSEEYAFLGSVLTASAAVTVLVLGHILINCMRENQFLRKSAEIYGIKEPH